MLPRSTKRSQEFNAIPEKGAAKPTPAPPPPTPREFWVVSQNVTFKPQKVVEPSAEQNVNTFGWLLDNFLTMHI